MGYIGLSREEAIRKHRKLWGWIAAETRRLKRCVDKNEYFLVHGFEIDDIPENCCFCCQYAYEQLKKEGGSDRDLCKYCPINWESNSLYYPCECATLSDFDDNELSVLCRKLSGLFGQWLTYSREHDWKNAAATAEIIAGLKERKP